MDREMVRDDNIYDVYPTELQRSDSTHRVERLTRTATAIEDLAPLGICARVPVQL